MNDLKCLIAAVAYCWYTGFEAAGETYDKQHCVPFGEYILFGDLFPSLYNYVPFAMLTPGHKAMCFEIGTERHTPLRSATNP